MHAMPKHSTSTTQLVPFSFNLPDLHLKRLAVLFYTISYRAVSSFSYPNFLKCCYKGSLFPVFPLIFSWFSIQSRMLSSCSTMYYARFRAFLLPACGCLSPVPAHGVSASSPYCLMPAGCHPSRGFHPVPKHLL